MSIIKEGPTFRDELTRQPQDVLRDDSIESLRIVPAKSAATGVYAIYFDSAHREWALVRLVIRYRWLFEIQLNRGMSGERQLLQQGFTPDDLAFLFDIIPAPPEEYNPIVYDMLWLVATYDEYRALTEAMLDRDRFTPRELFGAVSTVDESKIGFLTRFLRSHLIEPVSTASEQLQSHDTASNGDLHATIDETYTVTVDGEIALQGILAEYDRIFEDADFEPLFINAELDPRRHLAEYSSDAERPAPDVSFDEIQNEGGMLGEIASSFSSLVDEADGGEEDASTEAVGDVETDAQTDDGVTARADEGTDSPRSAEAGDSERRDRSDAAETTVREASGSTGARAVRSEQDSDTVSGQEETESPEFGAYTESGVVDGAVAAARYIRERTVARSQHVKQAVWDAVDVGDRDRTELWEYVTQVLMAMDSVHGRPHGRIWTTA
ncbi:hypothetical protein C466_05148 [Halorubrum distributum JCM 10118]|uniref:Uncharacterized protein n=1 Tax=Halorubrum distributum JCM 10118 TaxID=1227468 RepID=M0F6W1_9EURY|nr:hypothetical protein C466_05148 [Halorubrum distributum JCM 10118]